MFHVVLFEPEIPPNTGNIIRLCANTGTTLHLVRPLGFTLRNPQLLRAGLDYHDLAQVRVHRNWQDCLATLDTQRIFAVTTGAMHRYDCNSYAREDVFLFGSETRGLPQEMLEPLPAERRIRLPMRESSRSLNLSNAVAVVVYEAWRQLGFSEGM